MIQCIACQKFFDYKNKSEFAGEWRGDKMCMVCEILCREYEKEEAGIQS